MNRAGFTGFARGRRVRINAHHLRGPEITPGARARIPLLGDSVFFAAGSEYGHTPAPVLKGALGAEVGEHGCSAYVEPLFREEPREHNRRVLQRIHGWCRAREIPFLLVVFPHRDRLGEGAAASRPQELLAGLGAEAGLPVIDLRPVLGREDFACGDPVHLDRGGIRKARERVAEETRRARAPEGRLH